MVRYLRFSPALPLVFGCAAVMASLAASAAAQQPVTQEASVSATFVIDAIDHSSRLVTLKDSKGLTTTLYAGPEIKRFDELKIGDQVTFQYRESIVSRIRKPGEKAATTGEQESIERGQGPKPSATISNQVTAMVTVEAIDPDIPSVTVRSADGHRMSFKIEDKKNLTGVKAGDQVEITYTRALAVSVESPKKP